MSEVASRLYTVGEASAVSGLTVKAVNNAIDKGVVWIDRPKVLTTRVKSVRRLSEIHLVRLKLWHVLGGVLSKDRREHLFANMSVRPHEKLVKVDEMLFVDVAAAFKEVAAKLGELAEAEAAVERKPSVMNGEPVFKGTRIPVRLIAGMVKDGVSEDVILEGYPKLDRRLLSLAVTWAAAHPARGRPKLLKDKGIALLSSKRISLDRKASVVEPRS
ncbi:MAG: DUF433 domain-containing protein [Sphingomonadales bacterium]|jgi:uncharacterized protein (DUF433 family)